MAYGYVRRSALGLQVGDCERARTSLILTLHPQIEVVSFYKWLEYIEPTAELNAPSAICRYLPIVQSVLEIAGELDSAFLDGVHDVGQADELRLLPVVPFGLLSSTDMHRVNGQFDVPAGGQVKVPTLCGMF
ncbi:hypothetical protein L2299_17640 [Gordonia hongkongensis]|uniref:Resolvase/invertase-type recombinase catalytic domain-containing protein n=1 Tax=Gordonia hongkongensis TaxID=1701090 RepID=A0ABT6BY13_9ACTN|nr:hypothetical protein [Gordonia hongkongensis]MDF6102875.1 hypothetical protein [Gordonia hongkongensis]